MTALDWDDTPEGEGPQGKPSWVKNKVNTRTIRSSSDYKAFWKRIREKAATHRNPDGTVGAPCAICGGAIEYWRRHPDQWAWSLQHKIPVARRPDLLLDEGNVESSHWICNTLAGTDEVPSELGDVTDW